MAKFANKSKPKPSKRKTLKQKYKIERKVKESKKRMRQQAKKLAKSGVVKKSKRVDPTLPNLYPFKAEVLEAAKRQKQDEIKQKKEKIRAKNEEHALNQKGGAALNAMESEGPVYHFEGRKYARSIDSLLALSNVMVEVLDARDPESCRNKKLEKQIVNKHGKVLILLLNKVDLVSAENAEKWQQKLSKQYPTVMFRSNVPSIYQHDHFGSTNNAQQQEQGNINKQSRPIGHGYLFYLAKESLEKNNKTKTSVDDEQGPAPLIFGFFGYQNTGKSSVINTIKKTVLNSHLFSTANPEVINDLTIEKNVHILDTSAVTSEGIPDNSVLFKNQRNEVEYIRLITEKVDRNNLLTLYRIANFKNVEEFLLNVAKASGKLSKGGQPDINRATKQILLDWVRNKMSYFTPCH